MVATSAKRILVIDADPYHRQIVRLSLRTLGGWEVMVAASGLEGLLAADHEQPDAIVLEGIMPEMDVTAFLDQLRLNPTTHAIPVVFLTAEPSLTERPRFAALGAAGAIAKPFDPLTLVPKISAVLGWSWEPQMDGAYGP